ncbi:MAG TPA: potassium-transporting ATPase subunit KdpA, partial [Candidatus Paceibacterota bacterium]|nr:potassium-transporting ATPase subunit KdpA [Candidatus Paceibacterota bacterium]
MPLIDWLQLGIYIAVIVVITRYLGAYLVRVLDPDGKTFLDKLMKPLERVTYRLLGIDPHKEQNWKQYTVAMLIFSAVSLFFTYIILRIQQWLPLNPQGLPNLSPHLAFNTAVSFTTNTNWQSYAGEATMSYFSQMVALVIHNFVSAATGIALAAALVRGVARHTATTIGNFWTDLTRTTYYLLLPIAFVFAVVLVAQGIPQNFHPYTTANVIQPTSAQSTQSIPQGPIASQEAIKMIGTNGGGYLNANSAAPYENPNGLSNFLEMLGIIGISSAL